jgi:hypothetical protein
MDIRISIEHKIGAREQRQDTRLIVNDPDRPNRVLLIPDPFQSRVNIAVRTQGVVRLLAQHGRSGSRCSRRP